MIPYGMQTIDIDDINAVTEFLNKSQFLTTGPYVDEFENNSNYILVVSMQLLLTVELHHCMLHYLQLIYLRG